MNSEDIMKPMLKDRIAVVTGAGNGIGRAHAISMARHGAKVVVNDIGTSTDGVGTSNGPADKVVSEIIAGGGTAVPNYDSVATEDGANRIIDTAVREFGRIDILVNNAGVVREPRDIDEVSFNDWDVVLKTHLYGMFFTLRRACSYMKKQKYGRVVNTASHTAFGWRGFADYSAAKEGIVGLTRTVARDVADFGITVNAIRPIAAWRGTKENIPLVAANRPEDVASLVTYLVSEEAGNTNGQIFEVWKGHVGIFVDPPPVKEILKNEKGWTTEELAELIPNTLAKGLTATIFPEIIHWD
ncbi:MAG: SDR family oxidoreductase [Deltaproteobacteria bacterium]|nr:SDR family oxidoreductase [Deltaproteobacteria bacterium]